MSNEIFEAMIEHCKQARRVPVPFHFAQQEGRFGVSDPSSHWIAVAHVDYRPYRPRWLLIETPGDFLIEDVRFGQQSMYPSCRGTVPAALYSMADALAMTGSPIEAWKRFEIDSVDALHVGTSLQVIAVLPDGKPHPTAPVRGLWIGDEPKFRKWEAEVAGTVHMVGMSSGGPFVEVQTRLGESVRVPIKPSDITYLMDKIGRAVKFTLETGDDR